MGEVIVDDGMVLFIVVIFVGVFLLMVDVVIVFCGNIVDIVDNGDVNYYLMEVYKYFKLIVLVGDVCKFKVIIKVVDQGEEGIVEVDNVDGSFMDELLMLMVVYCVWLCIFKIDKIFV